MKVIILTIATSIIVSLSVLLLWECYSNYEDSLENFHFKQEKAKTLSIDERVSRMERALDMSDTKRTHMEQNASYQTAWLEERYDSNKIEYLNTKLYLLMEYLSVEYKPENQEVKTEPAKIVKKEKNTAIGTERKTA